MSCSLLTNTYNLCEKSCTGGKKGAPAKGKDIPVKPKERVWTKEDDAARKIQTEMRRFLAKKELSKRKKQKEDYEEMMSNLEKEVSTLHISLSFLVAMKSVSLHLYSDAYPCHSL